MFAILGLLSYDPILTNPDYVTTRRCTPLCSFEGASFPGRSRPLVCGATCIFLAALLELFGVIAQISV